MTELPALTNEFTCMLDLPFEGTRYPGTAFRADAFAGRNDYVIAEDGTLYLRDMVGNCPVPYTGELHLYSVTYYTHNHRYLGGDPAIKYHRDEALMLAFVDGRWLPAYLVEAGYKLVLDNGCVTKVERMK